MIPLKNPSGVPTPLPVELPRETFHALADKDPPLAWRCRFLGCGFTRVWEGGKPDQFCGLTICRECRARIATNPEERRAALRHCINLDLM